LLGTIHATPIEVLSAKATAPQLLEASRHGRSLMRGLRSSGAGRQGPGFLAPRGGMGRFVDELQKQLVEAGVGFEHSPGEGVGTAGGVAGEAASEVVGQGVGGGGQEWDGVIMATPAAVSARLLGGAAPDGLGSIRAASVVVVTLVCPGLEIPPGVAGILIPPAEGWLATAISFYSAKWPHLAEPGVATLRVSAGWWGDDRPMELDDGELIDALVAETSRALGKGVSPSAQRVSRWVRSFPVYEVGHLGRVEHLERQLAASAPRVVLCGASYRGVGIPACVGGGRAAARSLMERLHAWAT
ncbi:MAG: protoporphyrinogen/coproporphyrinogen oxidase, partial [Acidimicrobiales bacterium]